MHLPKPSAFLLSCISTLLAVSVEASPYSSGNLTSTTSTKSSSSSTTLNSTTTSITSSKSLSSSSSRTTSFHLTNSTTRLSTLTTPTPTLSYSKNTTSTRSSWYTASRNTTAAYGRSTPSPAVLSPGLPPHIDPYNPVVLEPKKNVSLFYSSPPANNNASDVAVASVAIPKMAYPAVVLDHSALVTHVECDLSTLRLKFLHRNALNAAKASWTMPKFVMMAFHDKCGTAATDGERDYLLVHKLDFDHNDLSVAAGIKHIDIKEAVGTDNPITVDMGSYTPANASGNVGFDTTAAPPIPSNGTYTNSSKPSLDFDVALDNTIGYTSLSTPFHTRFIGLDEHQLLQIRSWCHICDKVVHAVKKIVNKFIPSWTLTPLNKDINVSIGGGNVATPWNKKGYQLYSKTSGSNYIRLYCVDCGVSGVINVKATVTFNLIGIISAGSFAANGHMGAGLGLGVDAHYAASIPAFKHTLLAIPLSPFAIPGLITIGPHLDLAVGANAAINADGKAYAGVRLEWPAIHAQLNLFSAPSASGWTPSVTQDFQAVGTVSLSADAYVEVSIGFGVSLLNGLKSYGVALVEKPDLYITGSSGVAGCQGIKLTAGFKNEVYADILGSHKGISTWNGPSASKCLGSGKRDAIPALPARAEINGREARKVKIESADGSIGMHYADNGNIYGISKTNGSVDMSTVDFSSLDSGIITGDATSRVFHGYNDTLSSKGISRFRLSPLSHIPKTAVILTLQPSTPTTSDHVLIALDASHNVFYPVLCTFGEVDFPKLFLVKDPNTGVAALLDEANVEGVTGVKPEDCGVVPLVSL